jgi:CRP/FNR family transcriptional regulator, anaerobic regulatory protein
MGRILRPFGGRPQANPVVPVAWRYCVSHLVVRTYVHCMIETITEVRYRNFKRAELQKILFEHPDLIQPLSKAWIGEKLRADQLAIDLGRRTAHERIARLILNLMERIAARGMMRGETMDFPLRQTHIADATGLTPVHVSTVLTEFRRNGLVGISERSITILNLSELRRAANER